MAHAEHLLLLDTHVWVWYVEGDTRRLSRRIEPLIEAALLRDAVVLSTISVWEVAQLEAAGRLEFGMEIRTWVGRALGHPGMRLEGLTPAIAIESTRLPGEPHRDPADRILIATARLAGATIVTCDDRILEYSARKHVRARDAQA
jgi:PIN domain nuclease of toxin-antitoxin system